MAEQNKNTMSFESYQEHKSNKGDSKSGSGRGRSRTSSRSRNSGSSSGFSRDKDYSSNSRNFRSSGRSRGSKSSNRSTRDSDRTKRFNSRGSNNSRDRNSRFSDSKENKYVKFDKIEEKFTSIKFPNTYLDIKRRGLNLFTKNLIPGQNFFDENIIFKNIEGNKIELRNWDPKRSKLGAAIANKISQLGIDEGSKVLYLGASHGFTPSFVSDMVGEKGFVFCLDFAPRVVRDLYLLCQKRPNMAPIIADANKPEDYEDLIPEVDVIFMDIAQREQVKIFLKNFKFLKKGGFGLLALKARSIDVTKKPKYIFAESRKELEKHVTIVDYRELEPYEKDHCFFVCKKK